MSYLSKLKRTVHTGEGRVVSISDQIPSEVYHCGKFKDGKNRYLFAEVKLTDGNRVIFCCGHTLIGDLKERQRISFEGREFKRIFGIPVLSHVEWEAA